jgi:hypothetical protein
MTPRTFGQFNDEWRRQQMVEDPLPLPLPKSVIMPSRLFGPWTPDTPEPDRRAGLRALAALTAVFAGSSHLVVAALRRAEAEPETAGQALALFDKLPTLRRRQVLATYARIMSPPTKPRGPS